MSCMNRFININKPFFEKVFFKISAKRSDQSPQVANFYWTFNLK